MKVTKLPFTITIHYYHSPLSFTITISLLPRQSKFRSTSGF